jgi:hypothetical protein
MPLNQSPTSPFEPGKPGRPIEKIVYTKLVIHRKIHHHDREDLDHQQHQEFWKMINGTNVNSRFLFSISLTQLLLEVLENQLQYKITY